MNFVKKGVSLTLVLILLASIMVIPAFASGVPLDPEWRVEFRRFKMLSQGSPHTQYVCALQQFLWAYPNTRTYIVNAGGVDGSFGSATGTAVRVFQADAQLEWLPTMSVDGIAGGDTWASVAYYLSRNGSNFNYEGTNVMQLKDGVLKYYNQYSLGSAFHTVVGSLPDNY